MSLAYGLFTANKVDARAVYNDRSVTSTFNYVTKQYTAVSDADAEKAITDADYEKYTTSARAPSSLMKRNA